MDNPIDDAAIKAESMIRSQLASIDRTIGNAPPTGKRNLTRQEKLVKSLSQDPRSWTPNQGKWVLSTLLRIRKGGKP
jgi:hypothetical protein